MDAVTYVRSRIEQARRTSARRLPSIAVMARESGLPHHQIHRAVARLRGPERLQVRRGSGILLAPERPASSKAPSHAHRRTAADRAAAALMQRINRGAFPDTGPLPSVKELSHELGVHRETMHKVMRRLADEGWVRRERRRWCVVRRSRDGSDANHIVFLGGHFDQGLALSIYPGGARMMSALDQECARRGIRFQFGSYDWHLEFPEPGAERAIRSALGVVIWPYCFPKEHTIPELVSRCRALQERVAVLDQTGHIPHAGQFFRGLSGARCYSLAQDERDGYDVAMHVLKQGHRRAAFLAYEDWPWSRRRQEGIIAAFTAYGRPHGAWVVPPLRHPVTYRSPEAVSFIEDYEAFLTRHGFQVRGEASQPTKPYQFVAREALTDYFIKVAMAKQLEPVFERALADRSVTVWICATDAIAFAATQFLAVRKIRVPADISLVGFDDSRLAMHYRFNSYNFNMHGLAAEIVTWILHGSPRDENGVVRRVEGFVNDRGTVALRR